MIFISYRRSDSEDLALLLADNLREHFGADAVFLDRSDIEVGDNWRETIEVSLLGAKVVLAVIGQKWLTETDEYGHRRIDCEDDMLAYELSVALRRGIVTIPLYVHGIKPLPERAFPSRLSALASKQWIEFDILRDVETLAQRIEQIPGAQPTDRTLYRDLIKPLNFDAEVVKHLHSFTGREWVEENLDLWLSKHRGSRVFCLLGGPGIGKSAIACYWFRCRKDVIAFHQCVFGYAEKTNTKRILLSLAAQIAAASPAYAERICQMGANELRDVVNKADARAVFDNLFLKPLGGDFPAPDQDRVVVIDALDEASESWQTNELARFLGEVWPGMPEWLRLVVTSRPEMGVIRHLNSLHPFILDAESQQNLEDIRAFLVRELAAENATNDILDQIVQKSEGMFLYARLVVDEVHVRRLSLTEIADFPEGMAGAYDRWFSRKFPDIQSYKRDFHQLVSTIIVQKAPLPISTICSALGMSLHELQQKLSLLGILFPLRVERYGNRDITKVTLMHKSLHEWLTELDKLTHLPLGPFAAEPELGNRLLAEEGWKVFSRGQITEDIYFRQTILVHLFDAGQIERVTAVLLDPGLLDSFWTNEYRHEWQRQINTLSKTLSLSHLIDQWIVRHGSPATATVRDAVGASRLCELLLEIGAFDQVVMLAAAALGIFQVKHINDSPDMIGCLLALGRVQSIREELDSATRSYEKAHEIAKQAYPKDSLRMADVLNEMCIFYSKGKRDYKKASECVEECLAIRSRHNPPEQLGMANCINDRAVILTAEGVHGDYLSIYQEALSLFEKARPNGHPEMVSTLGNIANEFRRERKTDEAISCLRRAATMAERCLLPQHEYNEFVLTSLSDTLITTGEYDTGMEVIRGYVTRLEQFSGPDHDRTVEARIKYCRMLLDTAHLAGSAKLGACLDEIRSQCQKIRRAEPRLVQQLLWLAETARRGSEPVIKDFVMGTALRTCRAFAGTEAKNASESVSAKCFQDVLELLVSPKPISEIAPHIVAVWEKASPQIKHEADCLPRTRKLLVGLIAWRGHINLEENRDTAAPLHAFDLISIIGIESPDTLDHLASLTVSLHRRHHEAICEDLCRRLVEKSERILGAGHVQTLKYVGNLTHLMLHLNKLQEAEDLLRQAFASQLAARGGCERDDSLSTINSLATCLLLMNRTDDARKLIHEHIALLPESKSFTSAKRALARFLSSSGVELQSEFEKFDAARVCYELSIEIDPDNPITLSNMADLLVAQGDFTGAEPLYRGAMEASQHMLGAEHPDTLQRTSELASALQLRGDLTAAEPLFRRVYEIREQKLGPEHPNTVTSMLNLTDLLDAAGNCEEARKIRLRRISLQAGKQDLPPLELRTLALDAYQVGEYALARALLERAIAVGFELASNHCHLARIALLLDDLPAAREHAKLASGQVSGASDYVGPRILWFQLTVAVLDGDNADATALLRQLKGSLNTKTVSKWAMAPVLEHLRPKLSPEWHCLLTAIVDAMIIPNKLTALDQFPAWQKL